MNFIDIINRIFYFKDQYIEVSDEDKVVSFFMINRKLGKGHPELAMIFNDKNIDKASAVDMWFEYFKDVNIIPDWYWDTKNRKSAVEVKKYSGDYKKVKERHGLKDKDIEFLVRFYEDELKNEMKKMNKFEI
jgi:hypothetical protein